MKHQAEYFSNVYKSLQNEIGRIVVGNDRVIEQVLLAFFCEGHVLLEGVPGLGKTLLVKTLSRVLGLPFSRIQFTPDLMPADIVGTHIVSPGSNGERSFRFQKGPLFSNLVLADEINRATAKTQSALLEAMAESTITVSGTTHELERPFFVMATQNPIEMEGTYALPEAQLDRFFFKSLMDYPDPRALKAIVDRNIGNETVDIQNKVSRKAIASIQSLIRDVPMSDLLMERATRLIMATQPATRQAPPITRKYVAFGSSPRGLLALVHGAKARALAQGRLHVSLEDLHEISPPALRHRIVLNFEGEAEGMTADDVIQDLLQNSMG